MNRNEEEIRNAKCKMQNAKCKMTSLNLTGCESGEGHSRDFRISLLVMEDQVNGTDVNNEQQSGKHFRQKASRTTVAGCPFDERRRRKARVVIEFT
jgi:hypothetical protein